MRRVAYAMRPMAQRTVRVNELLQREISTALHAGWQGESVRITITEVDISPDLRNAIVYYSVLGDEEDKKSARKLLTKNVNRLREAVAKRVILKYNPEYKFVYDDSSARGSRLIDTLDRVAEADTQRAPKAEEPEFPRAASDSKREQRSTARDRKPGRDDF